MWAVRLHSSILSLGFHLTLFPLKQIYTVSSPLRSGTQSSQNGTHVRRPFGTGDGQATDMGAPISQPPQHSTVYRMPIPNPRVDRASIPSTLQAFHGTDYALTIYGTITQYLIFMDASTRGDGSAYPTYSG
jgi:hypothetical protein